MNEPRVLLLDLDGVLLHGRPDGLGYWGARLKEDLGIEQQALQETFFAREWDEVIIGKKNLKETLEPYLKELGYQGTVDDFMLYWFMNDSKLCHDMLAFAENSRKQGLLTFIATNNEEYRARWIWAHHDFKKYFDGIFASGILGLKKPDADFYVDVQERLAVESGEEIIFMDDSPANIATARAHGWQAILYRDTPQAISAVNHVLKEKPLPSPETGNIN